MADASPYTYGANGNLAVTPGAAPGSAGSADPTAGPSGGTPVSSPGAGAVGRYPSSDTNNPGVYSNTPASQIPTPQSTTQKAETTYINDTTPEDPSAIAARIASEYSAEISAINASYDSLTSGQEVTNANESGKTRATAASEGELGQDLGNASESNQNSTNEAALENIQSERGSALAGVYTSEATATEGEITSEKSTKQTADANAITYDQNQATAAQNEMSTVAAQYDLASLPQNTYDSLYEASGFSTPDEFNAYYNVARSSALNGGQVLGDATSGVWQKQVDGTWKNVIPAGTGQTIGDPTTGVYMKNPDGTYTNVIKGQPKVSSIGAQGSLVYDPTTGSMQTVAPAANKIVSSGGVIYAVNPTTNQATPLTANKTGWTATGAAADNEKAAIISYVNTMKGVDPKATLANIEADPTSYFQALSAAQVAGIYIPTTIAAPDPSTVDNTDAITNAALDTSGDTSGGS